MNITKSFIQFMEDEGFGTFGTDIFIGGAPLEAPDPCWWVLSSGGTNTIKTHTGEKVKNYTINVFYRNTDAEDVYETLQTFEEDVNSAGCIQLDTYDTIEMEALLYPTDQDIDLEDRTVGVVEVAITVYSS